jgi:hypothetical protein
MRCRTSIVLAVCGLLLAVAPGQAHHALMSQYDITGKELTFEGVLLKMEWINPHSMLHLEVTGADGAKSVWKFQTTGAGALRQRGLGRDSEGGLKIGEKYTVTGFAARNGTPMGFLVTLKMPDGRLMRMWMGDPNG